MPEPRTSGPRPSGPVAGRPPSVDSVARALADTGLPHPLLVDVARQAIADGAPDDAGPRAEAVLRSLLQPVVNATGVLLHTNLGRAPFVVHPFSADGAGIAGGGVPPGYTNLELDLATGKRGSRQAHAGTLLARACGAEAAMVVNNGAAAVLLVLAALAAARDVVVSRSELVEIGGGFRVPDVLAQSGARLVEVGTTNRTRAADFATAIDDPVYDVAAVLRVHQSNYRIVGFTEAPTVAALAALAPPLIVDIGSGLLDAACPWLPHGPPNWLRDEPAARQTLAGGAALVTFSGDKLLGGPQAGIIAGRADLVARVARHPLARALRPGGLVMASLQQLALTYLRRDGDAIPFWLMATRSTASLRARAEAVVPPGGRIVATASVPGGGTLPGIEIASVGIELDGDHTAALRKAPTPIIARMTERGTTLDLRTVEPTDDEYVGRVLAALAEN